jgi:hypothetical protein
MRVGRDLAMIDAQHVAQKYAGSRAGFELVHYQEVGLPYYKLVFDALIQERKPVGPIDEYLLRAVAEGIDTLEDVAGILGLERPLVDASVVRLNQVDHLDYRLEGDRHVLRITALGERALGGWMESTPERRQLFLGFDRLTWQATGRHFRSLLLPRDARDQGLIELPAQWKKRIGPGDLDLDEVSRALGELGRQKKEAAIDLISILDVSNYRMVLPAVALVFAAEAEEDQQVALVVDGRISEPHGIAFAKIDGPQRAGLLVGGGVSDEERPDLPDDVREGRTPLTQVSEIIAHVGAAAESVDRARTATVTASTADSAEEISAAREEEAVTESELVSATRALAELPVRAIQTYEHRALLEEALRTSKRRLLIISPWIRGDVVNGGFVSALRGCARRDVDIHIGWGTSDDSPEDEAKREPVRRLTKLATEFSSVTVAFLGNTHAKVLAWDDHLVVTSFNWLSFRGDRNRMFRQEEGTLISAPVYVNREYEKYRRQVTSAHP